MELFNPYSLSGKTILVTGSSSGIGRGIAITCAQLGATVICQGRNKKKLEDTIEQMPNGTHKLIVGDLTKLEEIFQLVSSLPPLDGIVHCAGVGQRKLCKQLEEADINTVMDINFKAPVMLQAEILKQKKMKKQASIIFITSIASESPSIGNAIYSASKGALKAYSKCLALELAPRQIRVNCVSPAMVWTDLIINDVIIKEDLLEDEKRYPLKRYGKPEDIAYLVGYLLSDASVWMTNSNLNITGGVDQL